MALITHSFFILGQIGIGCEEHRHGKEDPYLPGIVGEHEEAQIDDRVDPSGKDKK